MDETLYGTRDKRGNWTPNKRPKIAPIFVLPLRLKRILVWLFGFPGYLWPQNAVCFAISAVSWLYLTPSLETMREFRVGWVSLILLRNATLTLLVYGAYHTAVYIRRRQQTSFKYNAKWPDTNNSTFLFGSQNTENVIWTMCSGVPTWTAYETFTWWMYANGYIPYLHFREHPIYFIALMLLVPFWRYVHFYVVHRVIHMGPLYHVVHKLHHKYVNPGPWSGLSMSPLEHIAYFSGVLIHFVVPSHPMHAMFQLMHAGLTPAEGHLGFDRVEMGNGKSMITDNYFHYLHHKYFEVNYGVPDITLDWWFGTAHDGSPEAEEAMYRRMKAKKYARGE
jgi:sterol desaturase/sphingolipid hydroxylase (fatty acid hydroxylase superfamily)